MLACVNGCHVFIVHLFHRKELVFAMFMPVNFFNVLCFSDVVVIDEWLILWSLHTTVAVCRLCVCVHRLFILLLGYVFIPKWIIFRP